MEIKSAIEIVEDLDKMFNLELKSSINRDYTYKQALQTLLSIVTQVVEAKNELPIAKIRSIIAKACSAEKKIK